MDGATPLTDEERTELIPSHVTTHAELNELEQLNITESESWAFARKHKNLISEDFMCVLHQRMFGAVWKWAGRFRTSNKNIGVDYWNIGVESRNLYADTHYWLEHDSYDIDEAALRFHHRLVLIHPFPNGNGRHGRIMTDLILTANGRERFSWGGKVNLTEPNAARDRYIQSLRAADGGDYQPLMAFVRA